MISMADTLEFELCKRTIVSLPGFVRKSVIPSEKADTTLAGYSRRSGDHDQELTFSRAHAHLFKAMQGNPCPPAGSQVAWPPVLLA
jgi:hypothetical protein